MIINMYLLIGQAVNQAATADKPGFGQPGFQSLALCALPDDNRAPAGRGLQKRHKVQRLFAGIQLPDKDKNLRIFVDFQRAADGGAAAGDGGMMAVSSPTGINPAQGTPRASSSAAAAGVLAKVGVLR